MIEDKRIDDEVFARLRRLDGLVVRVGVLTPRRVRGRTIAIVAAAHEFGTRKIPQRSFIGRTIDERGPELQAIQAKVIDRVIDGEDPERAANILGLAASSAIRERIRAGIPPALARKTVERKHSTLPLVDTGQLLNSITHDVRPGRGGEEDAGG